MNNYNIVGYIMLTLLFTGLFLMIAKVNFLGALFVFGVLGFTMIAVYLVTKD